MLFTGFRSARSLGDSLRGRFDDGYSSLSLFGVVASSSSPEMMITSTLVMMMIIIIYVMSSLLVGRNGKEIKEKEKREEE